MPRQLRNKGGITNVVPRKNYGLGSKIKDRIRKLIPNELASVAVKAAPFVAPFYPGTAALMRGIGRFDQRGSISDALKQGALTYGFGKAAGKLGGAESGDGFFGGQTYSMEGFREGPIGSLFKSQQAANTAKTADDARKGVGVIQGATDAITSKVPVLKKLPDIVTQQLVAGGITAGASLLASYFQGDFREQEPGETMEDYLVARRDYVGSQMRTYMDNYFKFDPEYSALDDAGRNAFVARYNVKDGGRIGYQTGGITMGNTLAENIRRNLVNQAVFQQSIAPAQERARKKAFNVFMTPKGTVAKDQGIAQLARDTGKAPSVTNLPIKSGTDIARMIGPGTGIGVGNQSYSGGQQFSNLGFAALPSSGQTTTTTPTTTVPQTNTAPDLTAQSEAYGKMMEQKLLEAYGRGATNFQDFVSGKPYEAEAATLGMDPIVYMDYLLTSDPQSINYKYRKLDPYYDPQFDMSPPDPKEIEELSPLGMYYQRELQRQIDAGIPESERIQRGQVMGIPGILPIGGTMPSMYESYEDALARNKAIMGLRLGGRVGFSSGADLKIKLKKIGYEDTLLDKMSLKELRELLDSEEGTFTDSSVYRPGAAIGGIPTGIMRTNKVGVKERDYRDKGGFVPVGIKEKADDVPAMLSKNEFVMTANAVRGAGGGNIEKGAQRMYDTMKKLEKRAV